MYGYTDYAYRAAVVPQGAGELIGPMETLCGELSPAVRVLEVGCGQGFFAGWFAAHGCHVVGIDEQPAALELARRAYPACRFEQEALDRELLARVGEAPFDLVISTRRLDRVGDPAAFATAAYDALRPGGRLVCAAPAVPAFSRLTRLSSRDAEARSAAERWSRRAMARLLVDAGFEHVQFESVGRVPLVPSSVVLAADRPLRSTVGRGESPLVA